MLRKLYRTLNYLRIKKADHYTSNRNAGPGSNQKPKRAAEKISSNIDRIKGRLEGEFQNCSDFALREIVIGSRSKRRVLLAYLKGMVNKDELNGHIVQPLLQEIRSPGYADEAGYRSVSDYLQEHIITTCELEQKNDFSEITGAIFAGDTVIFIEGENTALVAGTGDWAERSIDEPDTETVVRGPREGFIESLGTNVTLLRRKIKNPNLKFEKMVLGKQTRTEICICYMHNIADPNLVQMVRNRLASIDTDTILESGYLEEFIQDDPVSLFPKIGNSEKPDKVAAKLLEGRVAILCDGSPFVLTAPFLFIESFQASEDYYSGFYSASILRTLRFISFFISLALPGLYVAFITFHQEIIPYSLLLSLSASREGVPISPFLEVASMGLTFEILREAGVRLPRAVGQAVSIVGALVLGESAVRAGFISNPIVIITALTAISSFVVTPLAGILPVLRIFLLICSNVLGLLGLTLGMAFILIHLCSLQSFTYPYLATFAPMHASDLQDSLIRVPFWRMNKRPKSLTQDNPGANRTRMANATKSKNGSAGE